MMPWASLFQRKSAPATAGRIYAIGDIHGCYASLVRLLQNIEIDWKKREPCTTQIVLLGDYIDRGPHSREVCELLFSMRDFDAVHCLKGNHEQALLDVLRGEPQALQFWLRYGGVQTLLSWGIDETLIELVNTPEADSHRLIDALQSAIAPEMVSWLDGLPEYVCMDNYLFVHAGIRPRVPVEKQASEDLLWIREPFLSSRVRHPFKVVHGHTEMDAPQVRTNRIGIDTGAYRTGRLTAVGLEGGEHWFIHSNE